MGKRVYVLDQRMINGRVKRHQRQIRQLKAHKDSLLIFLEENIDYHNNTAERVRDPV
jgi:hypothetical protein